MPSSIVQAEIDRQLEEIVLEMETKIAQGERLNFFLAQHAGSIAGLLNRSDLLTRLGSVISTVTAADLFRHAITNLDRPDDNADMTHLRRFDSPEKTAKGHPLCDNEMLTAQMKTHTDGHIQLCVQGDVQGAVQAATTKLALADIGCTLAAMGHFDRATAFIDGQPMDDGAKAEVRFIVLLEKCRRKHADMLQAVNQAKLKGDARLKVILALAGRLPWIGYPYLDW